MDLSASKLTLLGPGTISRDIKIDNLSSQKSKFQPILEKTFTLRDRNGSNFPLQTKISRTGDFNLVAQNDQEKVFRSRVLVYGSGDGQDVIITGLGGEEHDGDFENQFVLRVDDEILHGFYDLINLGYTLNFK